MRKKVLITGATGYLGSRLAFFLGLQGHEIHCLTRKESSLKCFLGHEKSFQFLCCDSPVELTSCLRAIKPDVVIHTATIYGRNGESEGELLDVNVRFGLNLLRALGSTVPSSYFINIGTCLPANVNSYAKSKDIFLQKAIKEISENISSIHFLNVSLHNFFGPKESRNRFIGNIMDQCFSGATIDLTSGEQLRDFIYIDDVLSAFDYLINNPTCFYQSQTVELGSGNAISIRKVVELIHGLTESKSVLNFGALKQRENEPSYMCANPKELIDLGWLPKWSIEAGLRFIVNQRLNQSIC